MKSLVFVYGSLQQGGHNASYMNGWPLIARCKTRRPEFRLIDLGVFPGAVRGCYHIAGEVYAVPSEVLCELDRLEGVPLMYDRHFVDLDGCTAWMYVLQNRFLERFQEFHVKLQEDGLIVTEGSVQHWSITARRG